MDLTAEEYVELLLKPGSENTPVDKTKPELDEMSLPPWYDEDKYNRGRQFYWKNSFGLATSMLMGLVAVFAVPSILRVLVGSQRSNSVYTAYKRYLSTLMHLVSWFQHELKPGSVSWRSFHEVRTRHFKAGVAGKSKGTGVVSPRDVALTQFGFFGFAVLKPDMLGIQQLSPTDWDDYVHFWSVVGHMMGIEDRYNLGRKTVEETRKACQLIMDKVYTPCLENVPEYFEHSARVMLEGLWNASPNLNVDATIFYTKYLADVPGYILTEGERMTFREKLLKKLEGKPLDSGVDITTLMEKPAVEGLPKREPKLLYLKDFDVVTEIPAYKQMSFFAKYKLNLNRYIFFTLATYLGRLYFNAQYVFSLFLMRNFPFLAFPKFGYSKSFVNIFVESPMDDTKPKLNADYYKPKKSVTWYRSLFNFFFGEAQVEQ